MPSSLDFSGNPLANDDRSLPSPSPLDFSGSPAGLDLSRSPASPLGLQNAPQGIDFGAATAQMQSILRAPTATPAPRSTEAPIYFSPSTGEMVVNGFTFNQRNASQALVSEQFANQPRANFTLPDTATDWREMPRNEYAAYLNTIKNPSYGRRMGEAWENAWRGMGDIAVGAGLAADRALTGDEDNQWLLNARTSLTREFEENAPFMMQMRDVQTPGDALTYLSQAVVQGAPWLVETAITMGVGGLLGGAVSGGVGAPAGAIEAFTAKEALRAASRQLLRNNLRRGAEAYAEASARRISTQQAATTLTREEVVHLTGANADDVNRFFNFGERAYHMAARNAGGSGMSQAGAIAGMTASNYATGVGDIRNSIADAGGDTESADAVANIWGLAIPYAFVESMGDLLVTQPITHLLPGMANATARSAGLVDQLAARGTNAARYAGMTGAAEGLEEGTQYVITQQGVAGATNRPIDIEPLDLLENIVGGALAGGGLGAVTGAMGTPGRRPATSNAGTASAEPIAGLAPEQGAPIGMLGPDEAVGPQGTDYYDEDHGSMGGLTPPDLGGYGSGGTDTRFDITGRPVMGNRANEEAEVLRNTLNDPTLTYDQRQSIQTAIDALSGSNELDREAADRGAAAVGEGVRSTYTPTPYVDTPGLAEEMTSIRQDIESRPEETYSYPGLLNTNPAQPVDYENITLGDSPIGDDQAILNHAIGQLQSQTTNTAPQAVLDPVDTVSNPTLDPIDPNAPMGEYNRPDDGLRGRTDDVTVTNLNAPVQNTNPIMPDGLPKYGNHRLKPMVDANGKPTGSEARTDLIEVAKAKGKSLKKNQKRQEQRRKKRALKSEARKEEVQKRIDKMVEEPTDESEQLARDQRNMRGFNRSDGERQARYEAERAASIKATEDTPFPDGTEEELKPKRNRLKEAAQRAKEASNAIPERSTKETPKAKQPRAVQADASRDSAGDRAAAESTDSKGTESVQSAEVNQSRVDKAKTALLEVGRKEGRTALGIRQKAANAALQLSKGRLVKQSWFNSNGDPLTSAELTALIEQLDAVRATEKEEKPKATSTAKAAELFHSWVVEAWDNSKNPATGSKETFEKFVLENRIATQGWIDTPLVSRRNVPAYNAAKEILEATQNPQAARPKGSYSGTASRILARILSSDPEFTFKPMDNERRVRARKVLENIEAAQKEANEPVSSLATLTNLLSQLKRRARGSDIQQAAEENKISNPYSHKETVKLVAQSQAALYKEVRARTTHVFRDLEELLSRANKEIMVGDNGATMSLGEYIRRQAARMKLEDPELAEKTGAELATAWVKTYMDARALRVPHYNALIVLSSRMESRREVQEVLEHELVGHSGLASLFPDRIQKNTFMFRALSIPGMREKVHALVAKYPMYERFDILEQVEEVLNFHMMEGPLAIEKVLSAEEAIDPISRHTLWQDFKDMVKRWIENVFPGLRSTVDEALDAIVSGLRQYAITGETANLHSVIDPFATITQARVEEILAGASEESLQLAAALGPAITDTPAETQKKLYGTDTNPARPYKKRSYIDDTIGMIRANEPLIEKLSELQERGVAAPLKEGLKKVGRELVTMNDMALKSVLIEKMMRIMHNTIKYARNIMTRIQEQRQYATKSAKTARIRALWGDKFPGSSPEQIEAYNRMALVATNNRIATLSDAEVRNAPRLRVRHVDGTYTINMEVYKQMLERGTLSKEEYEAGVEQFTVDKKGETTSAGVAKLTKEMIDLGYEMYVNETKLMAESALKTLDAMNEALSMRNEHSIEEALRELDFEEKEQPFAREALQRMRKLYADIAFHNYSKEGREKRFDQKKMAHQVLVELMRAFHEQLKVGDWTDSRATPKEGANPRTNDAFKWRNQVDPHKDVEPFTQQIRWFLEYDEATGMNRMEHINSLGVNKTQQYALMNAFQALINAETQALELENDVIQSIMGNYVEMTRKGEWRVALEVRDANGKEITNLSPELLAVLPVTYAETRREAIALQRELMEEFDGPHKVRSADGKDVIEVTFDVSMAMAPGTKTMGDAPKVREFLKVAELAGMTLKPHQMKVIANLIESAATRKRLGLQRAGTPGADINVLHNNSETMTRRAWQAAKTSQAWMLESTMTDRKNQYGDWDRLAMLQQNFDIANRGAPEGSAPPVTFVRSKAAVIVAEKELLRYAEQLRHMARHSLGRPTVNVRTTAGEQKLKITGEAEAFNVHAQALKASLEKGDVEVNLNDLMSKTGALRQMAVVSQLGTIAAGIMNPFTLVTHLPYRLTANHPKTGYGEGFEFSEVVTGIMQATAQVGNLFANLSDSAKVKKLLDDAKAGNNATSLTIAELEFMYKETLDGILMPQQTYSLTGGTESSITNLLTRNLMTMLLGPFSSTEAATRRISALVTYRLAKARYIAAGVSEEKLNDPTSPEYKKLVEDIDAVVFDSQGDYSNINRPRSFRGDWAQYVFQYKMFPLNTVLLIKNLPRKEQAIMLGTIFLLAGLKGEPFADDFADIYDTLLQSLGFKHDSVELQLTRTLEEIMPGLSSWVMRGSIDRFIPVGATLSSRLSMGDILPLTGVFRPEADLGRELSNALGPAYAANMDAIEWAGTVADFALQAAGAKPRTTPWVELIRRFPQGQVRAFTEAGMMAESGEIVDPRGRLVSDEVTAMNVFSRALGFYPLEASQANNAVRLDRMHTGYMRAVRARFVLAYANAYRTEDQEAMDNILQSVRDWNDAVEQTGQEDMEIRNFRTAAVRAGRAASSTTIERTSQGAPDYSVIDEVAGILNADEESE